ncbi:MAG: S8 family serine peptidase, partial [Burkholderiales bacterium]
MRTHVASPLRAATLATLLLVIVAGIAGWWLMDRTENDPARSADGAQTGSTASGKITTFADSPRSTATIPGTDAKLAVNGHLTASAKVAGPNADAGNKAAVIVTQAGQATVPFMPSPAVPNPPTTAQPANAHPANAQMGSAVGRTPASAHPANVVGAPNNNLAAPAPPPFIAPTLQQMRDQPAATTAAQVLSQQLDPNDPAIQAEAVRILTESANLRKKMAWERAKQMGWETEGKTLSGGYFVLIDFEDDKPLYHETDNVDAAMSIAADQVRNAPLSLNGDGMIIGLWEPGGGVLTTHQEFLSGIGPGVVSRAIFQDGNHPSASHATHVAGTLIGRGFNPLLRGMAPNATLHVRDSGGDYAEMLAATNGVAGLVVSSHSYGGRAGWHYSSSGNELWYGSYTANGANADDVDANFGKYEADAIAVDGLLCQRPFYLPFFSAGNMRTEGPPAAGSPWFRQVAGSWTQFNYTPGVDPQGDGQYKGGYDTLAFKKTAKNAIMVGAVTDAVRDPDGPGGPAPFHRDISFASTTSFSSWGPTDDGRIKPDIVANGWQVTSADDTSNTATTTMSGTSMATPTAAGSALLLQQHYKAQFPNYMRSSTLKAVILHTADDLGNVGPDYIYGWGLMNTQAAADVITLHKQTATLGTIRDKLLTNNESHVETIFLDGTKPLRVTLCWMDPAGAATPAAVNDSRIRALVNDLNLTVERKNGAVYHPYVMPYVGDWTPAKLSAPATT